MKRSLLFVIAIGAAAVILVVTGATVWMGIGARNATDRAVERVSDFYLEELAGRRSQVVSRFFETKADQMERAVALMDREDLSSLGALRSFIGKIKNLYGLALFALVDEDNIVYTQYTTYMGGSRYSFLSGQQTDRRTITTSGTYGGGKEICLAIPVKDRDFLGKKLKLCFIEINMDDIVSVLAFDTEEKGTRFSLYYKNGENLTGLDFKPVAARQNLLAEMRQYLTEGQHSALSGCFTEGAPGETHFTSLDGEQILYYSPIPETGWMITVLIPKNLVYDQISGIRDETMARSILQILVTFFSLLLFFGALLLFMRGKSRALLEAERRIAVRDALTGIGNKYAYTRKEKDVNDAIRNGTAEPFAMVVCDLNRLKQVNDTQGHAAGDELIRKASRFICELYKHSPVYRIGGDEFAIFLQGADYENRDGLLAELDREAEKNTGSDDPVIAAGMAEYEPGDPQVHAVFERADQRMYERKKQLKSTEKT